MDAYILLHQTPSHYHQAGEKQRFTTNYIELGRSPQCQVQFDDSFTTVSRRHAAIVKDGSGWKLVQISQTNVTLLNGHPVTREWYLQDGDEIQLSAGGPRLRFIIPTNNNNVPLGNHGLTQRLSMFRQQALAPYRRVIGVMAVLLALIGAGGGYWLYSLHKENSRLAAAAQKQAEEIELANKSNEKMAESISKDLDDVNGQMSELKRQGTRDINGDTGVNVSNGNIDNDAINKCISGIYFIRALGFDIMLPDGSQASVPCGDGEDCIPVWSGTGFLLSDGRFVTARHVVEPWYYFNNGGETDRNMLLLNVIASNGGKVIAHFAAVSSAGTKIRFTSSQCCINRSADKSSKLQSRDKIKLATLGSTDYAYFKYGHGSEGIPANAAQSTCLERGDKLVVLGFPFGLGANSVDDINPIYGSAIVAAYGLQNGIILTTDTNYEQGNSGGPVLKTNHDGTLEVVGLVSAGAGRNTGFVVPIDAVN